MSASGRPVLVANPGADLYGSDRMVLETVTAFVSRGRRVVVSVPYDGPLVAEIERRGGEVVRIATPVVRKSAMRPIAFLKLIGEFLRAVPPTVRLIRRLDPEAVVVNTITPPLWLLLARVMRRPTVCHVHEGEASASRVVRVALNLPLLLAHKLIINSRFSLGVLAGSLPVLGRRSEVVYNAVAGPDEPTPPRATLTGPVRLLYVGRLSPRKGPDVAVEALARLRSAGVDAHLTLVGAVFPGYEWFEDQLRATVTRLGLDDHVELAGFHPRVWDFSAASDIVLVPSTVDEPFGNTAVEAILAQRPLVVSAISGLKEAAAGFDAAVAVPPSDPQALADGIRAVVDDWSAYRERVLADAADARVRFSAERYSDQVVGLVDGLVHAKGA